MLGLDWGVAAARASVIAEWSGALLGLGLTRKALTRYPGRLDTRALRHWTSWRPLMAVNRDIFLRSLALQLVFFLVTVQGTRLGDATVAANALLLNGLLLTAHALDGLAHAVEALSGHSIGARDRNALQRVMVVAGGWSLLASIAFGLFFLFGGQLFIRLQTDIPEVRQTALTCCLSGGIAADRGLELSARWPVHRCHPRAGDARSMLLAVALTLPLGWLLQGLGNHGLWLAFRLHADAWHLPGRARLASAAPRRLVYHEHAWHHPFRRTLNMAYAIAAYLHFLAIFLLFSLLLLEHQLFRQPLTLERARSLFRIDIAFGITAAAVLASGIARAVFYGKGLDYYLKNSFFHAKVGLFVVVAVLSIYPTLTFLRWRPARGRPGTDHLERQRQMVKLTIRLELLLLALIPCWR